AFRMASKNPAESIGIYSKGWIQAGYDGDAIILSPEFELEKTIINGCVY
ncbi:MAG TPA: amidohydrolase family protein, partial [Firmicutes bacterium]|nr:amidohydrolase family protein [Bacillota bacterium]